MPKPPGEALILNFRKGSLMPRDLVCIAMLGKSFLVSTPLSHYLRYCCGSLAPEWESNPGYASWVAGVSKNYKKILSDLCSLVFDALPTLDKKLNINESADLILLINKYGFLGSFVYILGCIKPLFQIQNTMWVFPFISKPKINKLCRF